MLANTPAMLEAHYAVPMCGAVLHSINTRLDAPVIAFQLDHSDSQVLITDIGFSKTVKSAINLATSSPWIIDYEDTQSPQVGVRLGSHDYEELVLEGDESFKWLMPDDEWNAIAVNSVSYTHLTLPTKA